MCHYRAAAYRTELTRLSKNIVTVATHCVKYQQALANRSAISAILAVLHYYAICVLLYDHACLLYVSFPFLFSATFMKVNKVSHKPRFGRAINSNWFHWWNRDLFIAAPTLKSVQVNVQGM